MPADNNLIFAAETTITATTTSPVLDLHVPSGRRGLYVRVRYRDAAVASGVARVTVSVEQSADLTTWQTVASAAPIGLTSDAAQGDLLLPIAPTAHALRVRLVIVGSGPSPTLTYAADLLVARSHAGGATGTDPVPPLADPTLLVQDSFNRDDGPLGTADTGQAWDTYPGTPPAAVQDGTLVVNGNATTIDAGAEVADIRLHIAATVGAFDYPILLFHADTGSDPWGLAGTFKYNAYAGAYHIIFAGRPDTSFPTGVVLAAASAETPGAGDTLRLVITATTATGYLNDDVVVTGAVPEGYVVVSTRYGVQDFDIGPNAVDRFTVTVP